MDKNVTDRNTKSEIELVLKVIDGTKAKSSTGLVDTRLFTGQNKLWAIMDTQTCLWSLKQDDGLLPPVLRQRWTGFNRLLNFVKAYYVRRNIEIKEIRD